MRVLGLLMQLVVAVASGGALVWWLATGGMRLLIRAFERFRPLREGSLAACAALLLGFAFLTSAVAALAAWELFRLLDGAPPWIGLQRQWMMNAVTWIAGIAAVLLALAGTWAALREALVALGAARRRRQLTDRSSLPEQIDPGSLPTASKTEGRRIVILCDGTSNRPDQQEGNEAAATNVWKLYKALRCDETQVTWYQAGVGSDTSSTAAEVRRTQAVLASPPCQ